MTPIKEMLAPKGSAARPAYSMLPAFVTIHNTGNTGKGSGALAHGKYLQGAGSKKSVSYHYAVDDKLIVRIIPDGENAWHAGDGKFGKGNRMSLAIEICENPESDLFAATNNAAELTARLMRDYNLPITKVKQHADWIRKDCPHRLRSGEPYSWEDFLARVQGYYTAITKPQDEMVTGVLYAVQAGAFEKEANAKSYSAALADKGVQNIISKRGEFYTVQVGAFSSEQNAFDFMARLRAMKIQTVVVAR